MSSKTRISILIVVVIVVIATTGFFMARGITGENSQATQEIRIGVVQPLTGELANFGKTVLNGITLATDEFSGKNSAPKIRLFTEDSQGKPATAVSALQKLIDVDKVGLVIGDLTSGGSLAMAPIAQKHKTLMISPTASNPKLSQVGRYFTRVWPSDSLDGMVAAEYCYRQLGKKNSGVVYVNNEYGLGLRDVFVKTFEKLGGKIALTDSYMEQTTDFRTLLTKAKTLDLDVIYIPGHPRGIASVLKQAKELGITTVFFSNVAAEDKEFVTLAGESANGLYFTAPAFDIASQDARIVAFVANYKKRFSESPDVHAVKGYDAASVLLEGIQSGKVTPDQIRDFLGTKGVFHGISGDFKFDNNGDVITALSVKQYTKEGKVQILERVAPAGLE